MRSGQCAHDLLPAPHRYHGRTHYARKYCRHSSAATGKVAGGVAGAVVGSKVLGGGLLGAAAGAVGGVVAGGAIDRSMTARQPLLLPLDAERARSCPLTLQHDRMIVGRGSALYALAAVVVVQICARLCLAERLRRGRSPVRAMWSSG